MQLLSASCVSILLTTDLSAQTGKMLQEQKAHSDTVCDLQMSVDGSHLVTASKDKTAKLLDAQTLEVMKTYTTEYPVNTASLSPNEDHVRPGAASCVHVCMQGLGSVERPASAWTGCGCE